MKDMDKYIKCLDQIAEANHIEKIEVLDDDGSDPQPSSSARTAKESNKSMQKGDWCETNDYMKLNFINTNNGSS